MLELDGSDGGGQLVRTALALSAVSGTPFEMVNIRGDRPNPGLGHQHFTAVRALAEIAAADVSEVEVGDEELTFEPETVAGGEYEADIGTAGSITLLFEALLPLAPALPEPLTLWATGGTDVKWSPPLDYFRYVKLPFLRRHGLHAAVELDRRGFYPKGAGRVGLQLAPSSVEQFAATDREGGPARIYSVASANLATQDVAERQADEAARRIEAAGVATIERSVTYAEAASAGTAIVVRLDGPPAGFTALGERGVPAEEVAGKAVDATLAFRDGPGAVDEHMADQLVPWLALSGGRVRIPRVTDHVETVVNLVSEFGYEVALDRRDEGAVLEG